MYTVKVELAYLTILLPPTSIRTLAVVMSILASAAASASVQIVASAAPAPVVPTSFDQTSSSYEAHSSLVIGIYFVLATLLFAALGLLVTRGLLPSLTDAPRESEQIQSCEIDVEKTADYDKETSDIVLVTSEAKRMSVRLYFAD